MPQSDVSLLQILKKEVVPATGCTEPIAVAYAASVAGKRIKPSENVEKVHIFVDPALFKNGLRVGIPGIAERGLEVAAALGLAIAEPEKELRVLETIAPSKHKEALGLLKDKKISVDIKGNCNRLFVEVMATLSGGRQIKVVILDRHNHVASVEEGQNLAHETPQSMAPSTDTSAIRDHDLNALAGFCKNVDQKEISFLKEGVSKNMALAREGLSYAKGIGRAYEEIIEEGFLNNHMATRAEMLCAAASEARMSGSILPAMSSAGSGNHGITVFLTLAAAAETMNVSEEKSLRALAFANLITVYIKSYTGTLSAMCGCGVAAGIGASAGVAFMLDADHDAIFKSMVNMVGSITGLICDGGKEGCAYKLALSAGWAVKAALFAQKGVFVHENNGILAGNFKALFENLGCLCNEGLADANASILSIMEKSYKKER